ncbi:melanopsin isoform X1 [Heterocephalus glaber]|uniref:Melanopsin isoform X1 n=1 Tax=Heterocephalus glaber TaxID=10181 RepID=A0AAX6S263_HETGA|nr:melanopsin isoform X1 [Heterocephalus glaber]
MDTPSGPRVSPDPAQEPSFLATLSAPGRGDGTPSSLSTPGQLPPGNPTAAGTQAAVRVPFSTADVPAHVHYTLGAVILLVGLTGMLGNLTVIYTFFRSRGLRTPANMFVINLAVSDFLMSFTQAPVFFTSSLYKRWLFGEAGCEFYAFCGALFGITSMITLTAITLDRYLVITRPLATIGLASKRQAALVLLGIWLYALAWSLPPFFGWSAYVPEGLLTSCSWDYMTFTPSVRSYTMLLFCFVFFLPLLIIIYCYVFIFRAIRETGRAFESCGESPSRRRQWQRLRSEWKMAKIALLVILLFVLSWAPYSTVALVAFAGHAHILTPSMSSVPAVIAKASAIHNPIIYAIAHPKYRAGQTLRHGGLPSKQVDGPLVAWAWKAGKPGPIPRPRNGKLRLPERPRAGSPAWIPRCRMLAGPPSCRTHPAPPARRLCHPCCAGVTAPALRSASHHRSPACVACVLVSQLCSPLPPAAATSANIQEHTAVYEPCIWPGWALQWPRAGAALPLPPDTASLCILPHPTPT